MNRSLIYIALIILFACEKEQPESNQLLVVEGYLYAGATDQLIKLRLPSQSGLSSKVVSDAEVSLYDDDDEYQFAHIGNGLYIYDELDLHVMPNRTYELEIEYEEIEVFAETTVPSAPVDLVSDQDTLLIDEDFSDFIVFSWSNPDFEYYSPIIHSPFADRDSLFNDQVDRFNFSYPTSEGEILVDASNIEYFGHNEFILYSVTNEYLDLYQFTDQESGLIQPGNIQNGLGIFTSFNSDTVRFFVERE